MNAAWTSQLQSFSLLLHASNPSKITAPPSLPGLASSAHTGGQVQGTRTLMEAMEAGLGAQGLVEVIYASQLVCQKIEVFLNVSLGKKV